LIDAGAGTIADFGGGFGKKLLEKKREMLTAIAPIEWPNALARPICSLSLIRQMHRQGVLHFVFFVVDRLAIRANFRLAES
jgi:hypothetical protein